MRVLVMSFFLFFMNLTVQAGEIYFATRTVTTPKIESQIDCVIKAERLLEYLRYDRDLDHDKGSAWGKLRSDTEFKTGIRCAEGKGVIFIVVVGPKSQNIRKYANELAKTAADDLNGVWLEADEYKD